MHMFIRDIHNVAELELFTLLEGPFYDNYIKCTVVQFLIMVKVGNKHIVVLVKVKNGWIGL